MKKNLPLVSIIIPCYNHAQFVEESIQSVIDQDYENIELIIIDDGSEDESVSIIQKMVSACEKRFKRFEFRYRSNKGLCATLNEALEWCEGEFFSPLASDDIALPHKISFLVDKIKGSDYAAVFGIVQPFSNTNEKYNTLKVDCVHNFDDMMFHKNIPCAPAALLRKISVTDIGGYAEDVKLEDYYMWLSLTSRGEQIVSFSEVVTLYRKHNNNTTNNIRKMQEYRIEVLNKFRNNSLYSKAIKNSYLLCARELSNEEVLSPIITVLKSGNYNKTGAFISIRALTPDFLIVLRRAIRSR